MRLKFVEKAVDNRLTELKSAMFDVHAALNGDEKSLSRLNAELREL